MRSALFARMHCFGQVALFNMIRRYGKSSFASTIQLENSKKIRNLPNFPRSWIVEITSFSIFGAMIGSHNEENKFFLYCMFCSATNILVLLNLDYPVHCILFIITRLESELARLTKQRQTEFPGEKNLIIKATIRRY